MSLVESRESSNSNNNNLLRPVKREREEGGESNGMAAGGEALTIKEKNGCDETTTTTTAVVTKQTQQFPSPFTLLDGPLHPCGYKQIGNGIFLQTDPNGGGQVIHVYTEMFSHLTSKEQRAFATYCSNLIFAEDENENAYAAFGIFHKGASDVPNLLRDISTNYPKTEVVREIFGQSRLAETIPIAEYVAAVDATAAAGTHRAGQMRNISLVGVTQEEKGGYFESIIKMLENHEWIGPLVPWGKLSKYDDLDPTESDDGPILWCCSGEQYVPVAELTDPKKKEAGKRAKRSVTELLQLLPRNERPRYKLVMDRTGCHCDMAGLYPERHPVAAVGFVQNATNTTKDYTLKDIVVFQAEDMGKAAEEIGLYFHEEAKDQLLDPEYWADHAHLSLLRRAGVRYAQVQLQAGDCYLIPRKVVHQFQTISGCISCTWHLKWRKYYKDVQPTTESDVVVDTSILEKVAEEARVVPNPPSIVPTPSSPAQVSQSPRKGRGKGVPQRSGKQVKRLRVDTTPTSSASSSATSTPIKSKSRNSFTANSSSNSSAKKLVQPPPKDDDCFSDSSELTPSSSLSSSSESDDSSDSDFDSGSK